MISVNTALELISQHSSPLSPARLPLQQAHGRVLAEDIYSPIDIPAYPQSSMDGYAFAFEHWKKNGEPDLFGEVAAGRADQFVLPPGKAVRIFTGAPVPPGADTVVMQEKCRVSEGELVIEDPALSKGDNVRAVGSEIGKGALALEKGSFLSAAAIGFLAGFGLTEVSVYPFPVVSIIVTGNELQLPGNPLSYGQVYESNSASLTAALERLSIPVSKVYRVEDQLDSLARTLAEALSDSDLVLLTGGISVGDYDFTLKAAITCGVEQVFHKIRQKPGKPIFFGKKGHKLVFGLPGNPASVLTCFYEYVTKAIGLLRNHPIEMPARQARLQNNISKPSGITHFLKGSWNGESVLSLDAQESYKLNSFARANCLIRVPEETTKIGPGELVDIHLLPL